SRGVQNGSRAVGIQAMSHIPSTGSHACTQSIASQDSTRVTTNHPAAKPGRRSRFRCKRTPHSGSESVMLFKLGRSGNRGLSIASVLVLGTIAAVAAFSMAAITVNHLSLANRYAYGLDCVYLAESAVADAVAQMQNDNTF